MIFKQRLFTALLGLLFATVLTGQASALYDPGVGRFCSRDPVGYVDGASMYRAYFAIKSVDPSGLLEDGEITRACIDECKEHIRPNMPWGDVMSLPCMRTCIQKRNESVTLSEKWLLVGNGDPMDDRVQTYTLTARKTHTSSIAHQLGIEVGATGTGGAGLPFVGRVKIEISGKIGYNFNWGETDEYGAEVTKEIPLNGPGKTRYPLNCPVSQINCWCVYQKFVDAEIWWKGKKANAIFDVVGILSQNVLLKTINADDPHGCPECPTTLKEARELKQKFGRSLE